MVRRREGGGAAVRSRRDEELRREVGLLERPKQKLERVHTFSDSQLIINYVNGELQVKDEKLKPYQEIDTALIRQFDEVQLAHIKREGNPIADGFTSLGSTISFRANEAIYFFEIKKLEDPAFETMKHMKRGSKRLSMLKLIAKGVKLARSPQKVLMGDAISSTTADGGIKLAELTSPFTLHLWRDGHLGEFAEVLRKNVFKDLIFFCCNKTKKTQDFYRSRV
ncbi:hypothetical protein EJ110_NYTH48513 [Nymphaea thermarum]|nr:hypothetical protein EJ110_NYTH48513 [Nymphaea thermarum]